MEGGGRFTLGNLPGSTGNGPGLVPFTWTSEGRPFVRKRRGATGMGIRNCVIAGSSTLGGEGVDKP